MTLQSRRIAAVVGIVLKNRRCYTISVSEAYNISNKLLVEMIISSMYYNLPGPDIEDEKDEEDSFLELFMDEKDCWISPPPWIPVENDIPLELF